MILYSLQEVLVSPPISLSFYPALSLKTLIEDPALFSLAPKLLVPWKTNTSSSAAGVWSVQSLEKLSVHLSRH